MIPKEMKNIKTTKSHRSHSPEFSGEKVSSEKRQKTFKYSPEQSRKHNEVDMVEKKRRFIQRDHDDNRRGVKVEAHKGNNVST